MFAGSCYSCYLLVKHWSHMHLSCWEGIMLCSLSCMLTMLLLSGIWLAGLAGTGSVPTSPSPSPFSFALQCVQCARTSSMGQTDKKKGGGRRLLDRRQDCLTSSRIRRGQNGRSHQLLVRSFLTATLCLSGEGLCEGWMQGRQIVLMRCVLILP